LLIGHEVKTVAMCGWKGVKNGELLRLVDDGFDVFITVDKNMQFQQNLAHYRMVFIVLTKNLSNTEVLHSTAHAILELIAAGCHKEKIHVIG
jgi:hypothetical protein